jgi:hypothetical protein
VLTKLAAADPPIEVPCVPCADPSNGIVTLVWRLRQQGAGLAARLP